MFQTESLGRIGNQPSINDFVENKMKKVEKSFYSLNCVECKLKLMKPVNLQKQNL